MTQDTKYNGWTNYETWAVNLWLDNDAGTQDYMLEQAKEAYEAAEAEESFTREEKAALTLAEQLKDMHEENTPTVTGVYADLLNASLSAVNWYEIAKNMVDSLDKDTKAA